jgi:hypothetical protein
LKKDYILPKKMHKELAKLELSTALFCNSLLFKKEIAGLMVLLNDDIFIHFGIGQQEINRSPDYKLRMLNSNEEIYVFEFQMVFENKSIIKLHYNPLDKRVKEFFELCLKNEMMSLHLYNDDWSDTVSVHFPLDIELDWIKRNLDLIYCLKSNPHFYSLSNKLINENQDVDTYYFVQNSKANFIGF